MLWELELILRSSSKTEQIAAKPRRLSIEHVLPQHWETTWPLTDPDELTVERRAGLVNVLGNLTLVTGELNSAMSNAAWALKQQRLNKSILLLNGELKTEQTWEEDAILKRGHALADMIIARWPDLNR